MCTPGRSDVRELQLPVLAEGEPVLHETLDDARTRHEFSLAHLPTTARQLSRGEPVIPTRFEMEKS